MAKRNVSKAEEMLINYEVIEDKIIEIKKKYSDAESDIKTARERMLSCCAASSFMGQHLVNDTGHTGDPVGAAAQQVVDVFTGRLLSLAVALTIEYAKIKKIDDIIEVAGLSKTEHDYIKIRYLEFNPEEKAWMIAQKINYSERHARNIRQSALMKIEKAIG